MTEANLDTKALLEKYLRDSHVLNLATAVNNRPSNRDVFHLTPDELTDYIYITTTRNSNKMAEIEANPFVAFTTVPTDEDNGVVTSNKAEIHLTDKSIDDVAELIENQIPNWMDVAGEAKDSFVVLKLSFSSVKIFGDQGISSLLLNEEGAAQETL
ncbi:pyridoxamine 5'-phosphate oxidase family protein [Weissella confusa]